MKLTLPKTKNKKLCMKTITELIRKVRDLIITDD